MDISINSKEVEANLKEFINSQLPQVIEKGLEKACLVVESDAKVRCPVDDGQLRQSITHKVDGNHGEIGTNVEYAPYVEVGTGIFSTKGSGRQSEWKYKDSKGDWHTTRGMKAQPYLQPAVDTNLSQILQSFEELVQMIKKIVDLLEVATGLPVVPLSINEVKPCIVYNCYPLIDDGAVAKWRLELRLITKTVAAADTNRTIIIKTLVNQADNPTVEGLIFQCDLNGGGQLKEYETDTIHTLMYFDLITRSEK